MNKIKSKINKYPKGGPIQPFIDNVNSIYGGYKSWLKDQEGVDGYDEAKKLYFQYKSPEGKADTIGYGHKLQKGEDYSKGLTQDQIDSLLEKDFQNNYKGASKYINKKFGKDTFENLPPKSQFLLTDYQFNTKGLDTFPKLTSAVLKNDWESASKEYNRYSNNDKNKPLVKRNQGTYDYFIKPQLTNGGKLPKYDGGGSYGVLQSDINSPINQLDPNQWSQGNHGLDSGTKVSNDIMGMGKSIPVVGQAFASGQAINTGIDSLTTAINNPKDDTKVNSAQLLGYSAQGIFGLPKMIGYMKDIKQNQTNQKNTEIAKHKSLINSYITPNVGEGLPGFANGGNLPNFPMNKMLIAMENGGSINPQYIMKDGGDINKIQNQDIVDIGGQYHENGGTNVNSSGQPIDKASGAAIAEAQKGETSLGNYIFSDDLGLDKSGNPTGNVKEVVKTFAQISKKNDKLFGRKEDALGMRTKEFVNQQTKAQNDEALRLKAEIDQHKVEKAFSRFTKRYGGLIKMTNGGPGFPHFNTPWNSIVGFTDTNNSVNQVNTSGTLHNSWNPLMLGSQDMPVNLPNINVNSGYNLPQYNPNVVYPQPTQKEYNDREMFDITNQNNLLPMKTQEPLVYSDGATEYPMKPATKMESPLVLPKPKGESPDYTGLGLSTIAPAIDFAYGMKKDNNKYYANEKYGQAKNYLNQLPTDINIDANLAANTRDFRAASSDVSRRTPSVGNSVTSQLLSNKLNANNNLYQGKYNAENQLKSGKLSALSQLDYTAGETDRNQRIALEDKNLANKARREDLQLNAINTASSNLNTLRDDKIGLGAVNDILKYGTWDSKTKKWIPKEGLSPSDLITFKKLVG